uniref:NADH-ubiquinone oxidoreductase chain 6 n=1 Tax=Nipponeurorthus fuscinervis TaxID=1821767 RepID=A0A1S5QYB4_9NEOP|nr:NADH dehydrogenase subunit 6 [Nipponeurorthus fuscinervis]
MNQIILLLNCFLSLNFIQMNHPMTMGLTLLIQTILISLICGTLSSSYWFSYILFLIMLGGMLVLFIYVISLASNELISFNMNNFMYMFTLFIMVNLLFMFMDNFFIYMNNFDMNKTNLEIFSMNMENEFNLMKLYNNPTMNLTMMLINYLFLTLIIIVKITNMTYGPLRTKN